MVPPPTGGGARPRCMTYVYLLQSRQDGTLYLGWTTDLQRRLVEHHQGRSTFTRRKSPWQLVGFETYASPDAAQARERVLKRNAHMCACFQKRMLNQAAFGGHR